MAQKIGLIAPYESTNYGTMLQAYALARKIGELGHECEYVDYTPYYKRSFWERAVRKVKRIMHVPLDTNELLYEGVDDYNFMFSETFAPLRMSSQTFSDKYIPHSAVRYTPKNIRRCLRQYERLIVGSDQTWSMERYRNMRGLYMLPFAKNNIKCYAYAPSLGTTKITDEHAAILKRQLKKFEIISCREQSNCDVLSKLTGQKVSFVADPTLLLSGDEWRKMADYEGLPEKYIMAYILGEKECISDYAEQLGEQLGLPIFYVCTRSKYLDKKHHFQMDLRPEQWIAAIDRAACVVTDSFHGSLFSINMSTNFYVFTKREEIRNDFNDNDRISELLRTFHLEERFVHDDYHEVYGQAIDFESIQSNIVNLRKQSMDYLQSILE